MTGYIGAVFAFGFNFAPSGWALCNGQSLAIQSNEALYALIGTTYGGNGTTTFNMPNLQGRVPVGTGQGPGLSNYILGQSAGSETVTLTVGNLPSHTHPVLTDTWPASSTTGPLPDPTGAYYGVSNDGNIYQAAATAGVTLAPNTSTSSSTGNGVPLNILNPYQTVNYCICLLGLFPQRN